MLALYRMKMLVILIAGIVLDKQSFSQQSENPIDWNMLSTLRLTVKNIGGQPSRIFTWTEPRLLLEVQ